MTTRFRIVRYLTGWLLLDRDGARISFHRTYTGALRKRRDLIEQEGKQ